MSVRPMRQIDLRVKRQNFAFTEDADFTDITISVPSREVDLGVLKELPLEDHELDRVYRTIDRIFLEKALFDLIQ